MALQFGVFDHIEPVPGLTLDRSYRQRLTQIDRLDALGFYAYHLAEHHTPATHSLAPSQNVFLASVAQRTTQMRFGPCVYVLPLHHTPTKPYALPHRRGNNTAGTWARPVAWRLNGAV